MKKLLVLIMGLSLNAQAAVSQYKVDPAHSSVNFKIRHLLSKVSGKFKDFEGEFDFDEKKPDLAKGEMRIKVSSLDTGNEKRDEHLKSGDFFDAKKFDTIKFVSKKFVKVSDGKYKLTGPMTMRGITKDVTFDVSYLGTMEKDPFGNKRAAFEASTKINRKDFGIIWNKSVDETLQDKASKVMSKTMLGDDVEIDISVEATAKK